MNILFIQPSSGFLMRGTTYPVCRSIMTTSSYMKSKGYNVLVYDRCVDFRSLEDILALFSPVLTMIYVTPTASIQDAIYLSSELHKRGSVIVWGEVVASALAEQIVINKHADFVLTGETETKLFSLVNELNNSRNFDSIPGLTFIKNDEVVVTENKNCSDLDVLPQIDWDLIDVKKCFRNFPHCRRMLYMYTSRGCPYKCTYCYNTFYYNSQHRKRSVRYVLNEIKYLEEKYKLDGVNFSDELLLLSDEEINEIYQFRKDNNLNFFWGGETRADIYSFDKLKRMYEAGCRWFLLGIETGSEETRKQINKLMNQDDIKSFVDKCTDAGITTFGSFIIGFPDESSERLKETVSFALTLNLDAFLFNFYIAIPKTEMCEKMIADGKFTVGKMSDQISASREVQNLNRNYSAIPDKELMVVKSYFDWLTFTRNKKESKQKSMFVKKAFDSLVHFADGGFRNIFKNAFDAFKTFVTVLFYSHAYPSINKKYGLYNINKSKRR